MREENVCSGNSVLVRSDTLDALNGLLLKMPHM